MKRFTQILLVTLFMLMELVGYAQYCQPTFSIGCSYGDGATKFMLVSINKDITCSGFPTYYHDFTSDITDLQKESTYTLYVKGGYQYTYVNVYIDYDHDNYLITTAEELIGQVACMNSTDLFSITFTVPASATTGTTRLRVLTNYMSYPSGPCVSNNYGNCSDFGINIIPSGSATPPIVVTASATAVGANEATLNGTINGSGLYTGTTFDYGLTDSYGTTLNGLPSIVNCNCAADVTKTITGLLPASTYHFRLTGMNCGGTTSGSDLTFTTQTTPPTAYTNSASNVTKTSADLNAFVNANNSSTTTLFEYGTSLPYSSSIAGTPATVNGVLGENVVSSLSSLTPNTTYHYRIVTTNIAGTTNGDDGTFKTLACLQYFVSGGGSYCEGGTGQTITLGGSELDVSYQLYKDGLPTGAPVAGTGSELAWTDQPQGMYTVKGTSSYGTEDMLGGAWVWSVSAPVSISISASANPACPSLSVSYFAFINNGGMNPHYQWKVNDINVGSDESSYSYIPANNDEVKCILTSDAVCASGNPATSNSITMTVGNPVPSISGSEEACVNQTITYYSDSYMSGYIWSVSSGGTIKAGGGSLHSFVTVEWTTSGPQTVSVNYTAPGGCTAASPTVKNITVYSVPTVTITGPATGCRYVAETYTGPAGMTNYYWNVPSGTIVSGGGITDDFIEVVYYSAGTYTINLTCSNAYGCNDSESLNVTIGSTPLPSITGSTGVCVGTSGVIYSTEPSMSDYIWTVSAGGTITSGSGTNAITVTWNSGGAQTVSVNYTNGSGCAAIEPMIKNVTVYALPEPTITGSASVCVGAMGVVYSTEVGMMSTTWSVSAGGTLVSGQGTNSIVVNWNDVGVQSVSVTYIDANGCSPSPAFSKTVTVYSFPTFSITGPTSTCTGTPAKEYATSAGMSSYEWTIPDGTITSGGGLTDNFANVVWNTPGTHTITLKCTDSYGCFDTKTLDVTVYALPVPSITGSTTVCAGSTGNVYSTESGKSSYTWSVSAGGTITAGSGTNSITVTWNLAGPQTVSVSYSDLGGCVPASPTEKSVTVKALPVPSISGPATICGTPSSGNVYSTEVGKTGYIWTLPSGGGSITSGSGTSSVTVNWSAVGSKSIAVTYSDNGCTPSSPTSYPVEIYSRPVPTISGSSTGCVGSTGNTYSTEAGMTGYTWTVSSGGTISSGSGTNTITVDWTTSGSKTLSVTYTDTHGCTPSTPKTKTVTVYTRPAPVISGSGTICGAPSAGNIYSTTAGMTDYVWSVSSGGTITSGSGTNTIQVTWNSTGNETVSLSYTDTHGCTPTSPTILNVSILTGPSVSIAGDNDICAGESVTYTATPSGAGANPVYTWYVNGTPAASTCSGASLGLIGYYPFNGNANDASGNGNNGTVNGATLAADRFGNPNAAYTFNGSSNYIQVPIDINTSNYSQLTLLAWVKPSLTNPNRTILSHDNGSFDRTLSIDSRGGGSGYSCFTSAGSSVLGYFPVIADKWVQVACTYNQSTTTAKLYYNNETPKTGSTAFNTGWTYTRIGSNPSYGEYFGGIIDDVRIYNRVLTDEEIFGLYSSPTFCYSPSNGDVISCVITSTEGCQGTSNSIAMTVHDAPTPTITGPTNVCVQSTGNVYSTEAGNTNYIWSVSAGGTITAGGTNADNTITITWTSSGDQLVGVNYTSPSGCGAATETTKNITVNTLPEPIISGTFTVCEGSTGNVYTTAAGMSNYTWSVSAGGTITSGGAVTDNSATVTWNTTGAQSISVNYTDLNGCTDDSPTNSAVTVNPLPTPTITGESNVCPAGGYTYFTEESMSNYTWSISAGGTITAGAGTNTIQVTWNTPGAQWVSVNYENAPGCAAATAYSMDVTVYDLPTDVISGPTSICNPPSVGNIYSATAGFTNYNWSVSAGGTITSGNGTSSIAVSWTTIGTKIVTLIVTDAHGCSSLPIEYNLEVFNATTPTITGLASICGIPATGKTYSTEAGMTGYIWTVSAGGTLTSGAGSNEVTIDWNAVGAQTVEVTYIDTHGCSPASATSKTVTVENNPVPIITGTAKVCGIPSAGNSYSTEAGMNNYAWTVSEGGTITSGDGTNAITVTWTTSGAKTVTVSYETALGCGALSPSSKIVNVYDFTPTTISGDASICGAPSAGHVYSAVDGSMSYYGWSVSAGGTITSGIGSSAITVTWNSAGNQTVSVDYTDPNGCSPDPAIAYNVAVYALPIPAILGSESICGIPSAGNIYTTEVGMSDYVWSLSEGGTITSGDGTNSITVEWTGYGSHTVSVTYTDIHGCVPVTPASKTVTVHEILPASIVISASANPICVGTSVTFSSNPVNGGATPSYQWKKNGVAVGVGSTYTVSPANGDEIICILTSSYACPSGSPATSNSITMVVNELPVAPVSGGNQTVCSTDLPASLTANPPDGSTIDWYSASSGGTLLVMGSTFYPTSTAGTYYAESRNGVTGCKSATRTAVTLSINNATTWYRDLDGDSYGNPEITTLACIQPAGYVDNGLDCDDNNANINPASQYFAFTGNPRFENHIVAPTSGTSYTIFRFEVNYFDATNDLPDAGYPRLQLDYEGNGSMLNANDRTVLMVESDPLDLNTTDGKTYFAEVEGLPYGTSWKSTIVSGAGGLCTATFGPLMEPDVLHECDIFLFANDITFSKMHPDPGDEITVSAVIHNESDFDANDFVCHLINEWDLGINYPDILNVDVPAHSTQTVTWTITTPLEPAWCPMRVYIDFTDVISEFNEYDNDAVRPFINGDYAVAGKIVILDEVVSPHSSYENQYAYLNLSGKAVYDDLAVHLADSSVAGATVDVTITEAPGTTYSTYTNSWGYFSLYFPAPDAPGTYHVNISVTDYTLTGTDTTHFHILAYVPPPTKPNLTLNYCHSVEIDPTNPHLAPSIDLNAKVVNNGNATAIGPIDVKFTYSGGLNWTESFAGNLLPGQSVTVTHNGAPLPVGQQTLEAYVDPANSVAEWDESAADNSATDNMCYEFEPVGLCGGNFWGSHCLDYTTGIYVGLNVAHLYDANPVEVLCEVKAPGDAAFSEYGTGTLNNATKNCYCPYLVTFPGLYTFNQVGTYTFKFTVDPGNAYNECNELNNSLTVTVEISECLPPETRPNLTFVSCHPLQVEPVDPVFPGATVLKANIINNGNAVAVGPISVKFEYDPVGGGLPLIGVHPGNLGVGETAQVTVAANLPPAPPPVATQLTATVDPANTVFEWDESVQDNTESDYMCHDFHPLAHCGTNFWNRTYLVGQSTPLSVGLDVYYLYDASSVDVHFEVIEPGDAVYTDLGNGNLTNVTKNCYCPWVVTLPAAYTFFESGTYHFRMTADPGNEYIECDETNNVFEVDVLVQSGADMRVLSQFINPTPLNPDLNQDVSFVISYENIGNSNVGAEMTLKMLVDEVEISSIHPVPGLASGDHTSIPIPQTWSTDIQGAHVIRAIIDADDDITEINESNNEATRAIIAGDCANLYFEIFSASDPNPGVGDYIHLNTRIGNSGDVDCQATVKYYYIDDNGDTTYIGQATIFVLAHDSSTVTMPWVVDDATTRIIAMIVEPDVTECTDDDNIATTDIGSAFAVDLVETRSCNKMNNGTLTATADGGTPPYTYIWSTSYIGQTLTGWPGTYTVTVLDNTGLSVEVEGTIGEYEYTTATVSGADSVCTGSTGNVYTTQAGMSNYTWVISEGATITSGGTFADNTITVTWTTTGTHTINLQYADSHGCPSSTATLAVVVSPAETPVITGDTEVCLDGLNSIYETAVGMSNYIWTVSPGGTLIAGGGVSDHSITIRWDDAGAQTVGVTYTNASSCSASSSTSINVTVNNLPNAGAGYDRSICAGGNKTIGEKPEDGLSYSWTSNPAGFTSNLAQPTVTPVTTTTYYLEVTDDVTGCKNYDTCVITVHALPVPTIAGSISVCAGSTGNSYTTEAGMSNYSWSVSAGGVITGGGTYLSNSITITWSAAGNHTVSISYTNANGCTAAAPTILNVVVNALPVVTLTGPTPVCNNSAGNVYLTEAGMNNYAWTIPAGATVTSGGDAGSSSVTISWTSSGTKVLKVNYANANGCTAALAKQLNVVVNANPVPSITGPVSTKVNTNTTYSTTPLQQSYTWSISPNGIIVSGQGTRAVVVKWTTVSNNHWIALNFTNMNGCTAATPTTKTVVVTASKSSNVTTGDETTETIQPILLDQSMIQLNVFPNPNNGKFTLTVHSTNSESFDLLIFNGIGSLIFEKREFRVQDKAIQQIDISTLPDGVYNVVLQNDQGMLQKRILIRK